MKFRITDLILLTTMVSLLLGVFQKDPTFFRQLFCFVLVSVLSTAGVVLFSSKAKAWKWGAAGGLLGGLLYLGLAYVFVSQFYELTYFRQSIVLDSRYFSWAQETVLVIILSIVFGSAVGPLLALRIRRQPMPDEYRKPLGFSLSLLFGMFLIGILAMFDRLAIFGDVRDLTPLIFVLLIVFAIHTNSWLIRFERSIQKPN